MKPTCMIKSHPKGLTLAMDSECDFVQLVEDICRLFARSREFFVQEELILAIEGRSLTAEETLVVVEAIELNSNIKIAFLLEEGELWDVRMTGHLDRFFFERTDRNAKIVKGNIAAGEMIASDTGIVVIGDIKKGGSAFAAGNVMVFGNIEGSVRAGAPDDDTAFIVCGKANTESVTIGTVTGSVDVTYRKILGRKRLQEPLVIRSWQGQILAEPMSGGLIKQL